MIEVLLVLVSLALGGTLVFFLVCQHFRRRVDDLTQAKTALEAQVRDLHQTIQALSSGRATST